MTPRAAVRLAWGLWGLAAALLAAATVLGPGWSSATSASRSP